MVMFRNEYALSLQLNSIKIETSYYKQTALCFPISLRSWFIPMPLKGEGSTARNTYILNLLINEPRFIFSYYFQYPCSHQVMTVI